MELKHLDVDSYQVFRFLFDSPVLLTVRGLRCFFFFPPQDLVCSVKIPIRELADKRP